MTCACAPYLVIARQQCDKFLLLFFTSFFFTPALKLQTAIFDASPSLCKKTPNSFRQPSSLSPLHTYMGSLIGTQLSWNSSISANRGLIETSHFFTVSLGSSSSSAYVNISSKSSPSRWPLGAVAAGYPSFPVSNSSAQLVTCVETIEYVCLSYKLEKSLKIVHTQQSQL